MDYFDRLKETKKMGADFQAASGPKKRALVRDIVAPEKQARPIRPPIPAKPQADLLPLARPERPKTIAPELEPQKPELTSRKKITAPDAVMAEDLAVSRWEPEGMRRRRRKRRIFAWAAVSAMLFGAIVPTAAFPKFSIVIIPKIETAAIPTLEITADTAIAAPEPSSRKIPAIKIEVEKTKTREYPASGTKFFQERAGGTVIVFNAFSSSPQTLVAQTRFQDSSGKVFRLTQGLTIPGAEVQESKIVPTSIKAQVLADRPGADYNIGPTEFRIPGFRGTPKYQGFYAKSEKGFEGGFEGEARIVQSQDLKSASEDLTRRTVEEIEAELQAKIPPDEDFLVPAGGREITVTKIDAPGPGERFDNFPLMVTARGRMFAVKNSQVSDLIASVFLPKDSELAVKLPGLQKNLAMARARPSPAVNQMILTVSGEFNYWHEADLPDLVKTLQSSTPKKAEAYLRGREEIASFRVKRFPAWLWFIPGREGGLEIKVEPPA